MALVYSNFRSRSQFIPPHLLGSQHSGSTLPQPCGGCQHGASLRILPPAIIPPPAEPFPQGCAERNDSDLWIRKVRKDSIVLSIRAKGTLWSGRSEYRSLDVLDTEIHSATFVLPNYVRELLGG